MITKILIGIVAIGFGIFLGRPRRYERPLDEVDKALDESRGRRQWTKRHFTPLDLLRKKSRGSERRRGEQGRFKTVDPRRQSESRGSDGPPQVRLGR